MSSAKSHIKRTYASRNTRPILSSSCASASSSPTRGVVTIPRKRKRPLTDVLHPNVPPPAKRAAFKKSTDKQKMTQLHFCLETSILRTCPQCDLTYTRGAPDDESLHRAHCARVRRGLEWGKEEERELKKANVVEVARGVRLRGGEEGRIVSMNANAPGKVRSKIMAYLRTVNMALSAPDMTQPALEESKAYLFLLPRGSTRREHIIGCAVAQRISTAMAVVLPDAVDEQDYSDLEAANRSRFVQVEGSLFCNPEPLQTPLGIPRLFVSSAYRRKGIAQALLSAVCKSFFHGCELDPRRGELAFSQPTSLGRRVMEKFGGGAIRIYEEGSADTSQC